MFWLMTKRNNVEYLPSDIFKTRINWEELYKSVVFKTEKNGQLLWIIPENQIPDSLIVAWASPKKIAEIQKKLKDQND